MKLTECYKRVKQESPVQFIPLRANKLSHFFSLFSNFNMNPLGLSSCSPVIPNVLPGEEAASPAVVPKAPLLGLGLWPVWERAPALPAVLLG